MVADAGKEGGLYGALNAGLAATVETPWDWYTYINDDDLLSLGFGEMMTRHDARGDLATVAYGERGNHRRPREFARLHDD